MAVVDGAAADGLRDTPCLPIYMLERVNVRKVREAVPLGLVVPTSNMTIMDYFDYFELAN